MVTGKRAAVEWLRAELERVGNREDLVAEATRVLQSLPAQKVRYAFRTGRRGSMIQGLRVLAQALDQLDRVLAPLEAKAAGRMKAP